MSRPKGAKGKNTKWDRVVKRAQKMRELGYSDTAIAREVGVSRQFLWMKLGPRFVRALNTAGPNNNA